MTVITFPQWTIANIIFYGLLALTALSIWYFEMHGYSRLYYSKFRTNTGISSRVGMFIIYFVPLLTGLIGSMWWLENPALTQIIFSAAIVLHFAKRCLEVLFLHKYSGPIDGLTVAQITTVYTVWAVFAAFLNQFTPTSFDVLYLLGLVLFLVGEGINFYHHLLLARLRSASNDYFIPQGGLFKYVSCPHYFGELMAWLGIAFMSRHLGMYLIFFIMTGYLLARGMKAQSWYTEKFPDYPQERNAVIPFIL